MAHDANNALSFADEGSVMENGEIVPRGSAEERRGNDESKAFHPGLSEEGARQRCRNVKHHGRRKRSLS